MPAAIQPAPVVSAREGMLEVIRELAKAQARADHARDLAARLASQPQPPHGK